MEHKLVYYFYPIFIGAIAIEMFLSRNNRKRSYSWRESLTSLAIFLGHHLLQLLFIFIPTGLLAFAWQHRIFTIPLDRWWSLPLLFGALEFFYYWHHRAAHEIRWIWATHAVHHSAQHFNLSRSISIGLDELAIRQRTVFYAVMLVGLSGNCGGNWVGTKPTLSILDSYRVNS